MKDLAHQNCESEFRSFRDHDWSTNDLLTQVSPRNKGLSNAAPSRNSWAYDHGFRKTMGCLAQKEPLKLKLNG